MAISSPNLYRVFNPSVSYKAGEYILFNRTERWLVITDTIAGQTPITSPTRFEGLDSAPPPILSVGNTATIDLTIAAAVLTADFASLNISQFANDVPYL